ncbi:hypothetical protein [Faecalibacillus faecis]|uniref:hypothetical protein n=1 Tax=Faecalibacillus faecis TaxID=1982628 RepID=UPI003AB7C4B2
MDEVDFYLKDLESKFKKIDKSKYYLSYSGGKDSHFLYWFIKEYLHDTETEIVSVNTYMEHQEILKRMLENADRILLPAMKPFEIKEKYGSPCFSKIQDEYIERYQKGCRTNSLMMHIHGYVFVGNNDVKYTTLFKLNNTAKDLLLSNKLHKVSPKCCKYLKKEPFKQFEKQTGKKAILGVRGGESNMRKSQYKSCFTKDKKFTPLHDLSDELLEKIYKKFNIEIPKIYDHVSRTGCMGCPYGSWKGETKKELDLLSDSKRRFVIEYFKESYDVLDIDYKHKQEQLELK